MSSETVRRDRTRAPMYDLPYRKRGFYLRPSGNEASDPATASIHGDDGKDQERRLDPTTMQVDFLRSSTSSQFFF